MSSTDDLQKAIGEPQYPPVAWTFSYHGGRETALPITRISDHPTGADIYWLPADSRNGKRKKADIRGSDWVIADWDPPETVCLKGTGAETSPGALDTWRADMLAKLEAHEPRFTLIVDSGRGFQAGYRLTYNGQPADIEAARYALAGDDGDKCWAANHVFRMWGTVNGKTGKPARIVRYEQDNRHDLHSLPKVEPPRSAGGEGEAVTADVDATIDLEAAKAKYFPEDEVLAAIIARGRDIAELTRFKGDPADDNPRACDRSDAIWFVCNELLRRDVPDSVILALLLNPTHGISDGIYYGRSKGTFFRRRDPEAEARRQLGNAKVKQPEADGEAGDASGNGMACDGDGKPYKTPQNFRIGLTKVLNVDVRHDEFADRYRVTGMEKLGTELNDAIVTRVRVLFQERFKGWFPAKELAMDLMKDFAHEQRFHPVRDYLSALVWDGTPRLDRWLIEAGAADDTPLVCAFSSLPLMAAVARVYLPGTKFDQLLVLESDQGWSKSSALAALAVKDDWFTDVLPLGAASKEVIEATQGKWIIEVAELHGMRKGDVEKVKAQLSRTTDRARAAYGHFAADAPRQFVMIGTTNSDKYLKDQTGNRRFWPVKIGKPMDIAWIRQHRDQLWAEVMARVQPHLADATALRRALMLPEGLWSVAGDVQAERAEANPFLDALQHYLGTRTGKISMENVWRLLEIKTLQRGGQEELVIKAMQAINWTAGRFRFEGGGDKVRGFARGDNTERLYEIKPAQERNSPLDDWELIVRAPDARAVGRARHASDDEPLCSFCH